MKKFYCALGLCACAPLAAHAQSAVTVYGILDASVANDSGRYAAGPVNTMVTGGQAGSRIGFKGVEDLGGGLAAIFNLESGFNINDGALTQGSGVLFGRKALVGLQGAFGSIKAGRQDSAMYTTTVYFDPFFEGITGAYTRIMTNISTLRRNDNTLDYSTPTLYGFKSELAYSFGEVAGDNAAGRGYSGSINYVRGPFSAGLAYQSQNSKPVAPEPIVTTRLAALGSAYDFEVIKLYALFSTNRADSTLRVDARDLLLGATVPFGASAVQASLIRHQERAQTDAGARQAALGYTYALSKRTSLYARYAWIWNDANGRLGLATLATGGAASGSTDKLFSTGISHTF